MIGASVKSLDVTSTNFSGTIDVNAQVVNHNKIAIDFDTTDVSIYWLGNGSSTLTALDTNTSVFSLPIGNATVSIYAAHQKSITHCCPWLAFLFTC